MIIENAVEKIRKMEVRGAGRIARFAVSAVRDHVDSTKSKTPEQLEQEVLDVIRRLDATRPSAVSLRNSLRYVYNYSIKELAGENVSIEDYKSKIIEACNNFIKRSENAGERIGELGAEKIHDGFIIQTHCNSQIALAAIIQAYKQGKRIQVYATESRPWLQGHITVSELAKAGIPVTLMVDSAVRFHMDKVDMVFVGADTITADGDLINKIGTVQIALAAHDVGVPFIVCAETYKFSPDSIDDPAKSVVIEERDPREVVPELEKFPGVAIANPVFDITPARYITEIITDIGIIKPDQALDLIKKEFDLGETLEFIDDN